MAAQCILEILIVDMEIKEGDPLAGQGNRETRQKTYGFDIKTPHVDHSDQDVVGLDHDPRWGSEGEMDALGDLLG